jgi:hypothetical protein
MAFRILSLDGGGAWAIIQVQTLIALYGENATGRQVLAEFDLAAANSGGSLVLGGLIEDLPLAEIRSYFDDDRKRRAIFSPTHSWGDAALREVTGLGPKYDASAKLPAIEALMPRYGNSPLAGITQGVRRGGGADVHVLIIGFNYDTSRPRFSGQRRRAPVKRGAPGRRLRSRWRKRSMPLRMRRSTTSMPRHLFPSGPSVTGTEGSPAVTIPFLRQWSRLWFSVRGRLIS